MKKQSKDTTRIQFSEPMGLLRFLTGLGEYWEEHRELKGLWSSQHAMVSETPPLATAARH